MEFNEAKESGLSKYGILNYCILVHELTGLTINEVYDEPICTTLYYTCYALDRNKERETEFRRQQNKYKSR